MIIDVWGNKIKPIKCKKPTMRDYGGRTWDSFMTIILLDGSETQGFLDTTWGNYVYYHNGEHWYKVNLQAHHRRNDIIDIRELY